MGYMFEVCCYNYDSVINAGIAGADRVEICDNFYEGGTTPSYGLLKKIKENIQIPVHVMIRPVGGDFIYNKYEIEIMMKDIEMVKSLNFEGVVFGVLNEDMTIHTDFLNRLCKEAFPLSVTFHRAFDMVKNPFADIEVLIKAGVARILTSGGMPDAEKGVDLLEQLNKKAGGRIIIMPGGGITADNIKKIADEEIIGKTIAAIKYN
ncbi:MAG: copper homeostasis protein CutC [Bacteroidota bacterium]